MVSKNSKLISYTSPNGTSFAKPFCFSIVNIVSSAYEKSKSFKVKEERTTNLISLPLYLAVVKVRIWDIAVPCHDQILYTTNQQ